MKIVFHIVYLSAFQENLINFVLRWLTNQTREGFNHRAHTEEKEEEKILFDRRGCTFVDRDKNAPY